MTANLLMFGTCLINCCRNAYIFCRLLSDCHILHSPVGILPLRLSDVSGEWNDYIMIMVVSWYAAFTWCAKVIMDERLAVEQMN